MPRGVYARVPGLKRSPRPHVRVPLDVRFWNKVDKTGDCWLWTGATKDGFPYGIICPPGGTGKGRPPIRAHRLSWEMAHGPIPRGMVVCHKCDQPRCVRPEHLFLGTQGDNVRDAAEKGRLSGWGAKTHCVNGHPFSGHNLSWSADGKKRLCKECGRDKTARHKEKMRNANLLGA